MKKIAIFTPEFPIPSETFIRNEIDSLKKIGHEVYVITMKKKETKDIFDYPVYELKKIRFIDILKVFFKIGRLDYKKALRAASGQKYISNKSLIIHGLLAAYYIKKHEIDHIHCHFMHNSLAYGIVAAKLSRVTVSSVGHGHDVYVNAKDLRVKVAFCNFNIAVCKNMEEKLKELKSGIIHLIHCGINVSKFMTNKMPKNEKNRFLFVGRLVEKKGISYLLEAIFKIEKEKRPFLDIIGEGQELVKIKDMIKKLKLEKNIKILGKKEQEEIIEISKNYDAFIAPFCIAENGDRDTGPLVLKEAMAMGLPIITTDIMGCKEIVESNFGYTVKSKNSEELKKAILEFMSLSRENKIKMRLEARKKVEKDFNSIKQAKKLSKLIETVNYEH